MLHSLLLATRAFTPTGKWSAHCLSQVSSCSRETALSYDIIMGEYFWPFEAQNWKNWWCQQVARTQNCQLNLACPLTSSRNRQGSGPFLLQLLLLLVLYTVHPRFSLISRSPSVIKWTSHFDSSLTSPLPSQPLCLSLCPIGFLLFHTFGSCKNICSTNPGTDKHRGGDNPHYRDHIFEQMILSQSVSKALICLSLSHYFQFTLSLHPFLSPLPQ